MVFSFYCFLETQSDFWFSKIPQFVKEVFNSVVMLWRLRHLHLTDERLEMQNCQHLRNNLNVFLSPPSSIHRGNTPQKFVPFPKNIFKPKGGLSKQKFSPNFISLRKKEKRLRDGGQNAFQMFPLPVWNWTWLRRMIPPTPLKLEIHHPAGVPI
jgi:hypothetical protein